MAEKPKTMPKGNQKPWAEVDLEEKRKRLCGILSLKDAAERILALEDRVKKLEGRR